LQVKENTVRLPRRGRQDEGGSFRAKRLFTSKPKTAIEAKTRNPAMPVLRHS